jgi:hypothetical protein
VVLVVPLLGELTQVLVLGWVLGKVLMALLVQ